MKVQEVTLKVKYKHEGTPMTFEEHAEMVRQLVVDQLAVEDVRCEGLFMAEYEEES